MMGKSFSFLLSYLIYTSYFAHSHPTVLVTGGAGYIGTQVCKALVEANYLPIAYDHLGTGHLEAVQWGILEVGDVTDAKRLKEVVDQYHPIVAIHLAGAKSVGESVADPAKYYLNNLYGSLVLFDTLQQSGIKKVIFSSSATIYAPKEGLSLLFEGDPIGPINPYGASKAMAERILKDFQKAYGLEYVILRYFNVAGADHQTLCGERSKMPYNLIPIVLQTAMEGKKTFEIFGTDYPTKDGTCIRDFIHVEDLANAHVKAVDYLNKNQPSIALNLGTGQGTSVNEILSLAKEVTQKKFNVIESPRREGDLPFLVADNRLACKVLDWKPRFSDLRTILKTEWEWFQKFQNERNEGKDDSTAQ